MSPPDNEDHIYNKIDKDKLDYIFDALMDFWFEKTFTRFSVYTAGSRLQALKRSDLTSMGPASAK